MRVAIYRNLNRRCWSVKALEGPNKGRVVAHRDSLTLIGCSTKVSIVGRARVRRLRIKTVHAWVLGELFDGPTTLPPDTMRYNPYTTDGFIDTVTGQLVTSASTVVFTEDSKVHYSI